MHASVAQLDRALVSGTKGRGFESLRAHHYFAMSYMYLFTLEIDPLDVGRTYDELPPHLTLASRFVCDISFEGVAELVQPLFARIAPIPLVFGEVIEIGPKNIKAYMVSSSAEQQLHSMLSMLLDTVAVAYQYPQFIGKGHRPHVTLREGTRFAPDNTMITSTAYLIEVVQKKELFKVCLS